MKFDRSHCHTWQKLTRNNEKNIEQHRKTFDQDVSRKTLIFLPDSQPISRTPRLPDWCPDLGGGAAVVLPGPVRREA